MNDGISETVARVRNALDVSIAHDGDWVCDDSGDVFGIGPIGDVPPFNVGHIRALIAAYESAVRERDDAVAAMVRFAAIDFSAKHGQPWVASAELQGKAVEVFTASLVDLFKAQGGPNYVEAKLRDPRTLAEYFAYIGPITGKTPHELRREAEAQRDRARAALDATPTPEPPHAD